MKNEESAKVSGLKQVLERDFIKAAYIVKTADGINLQRDDTEIDYVFSGQAVLRKVKDLHTDTFKVANEGVTWSFEKHEANLADTVDQLQFTLLLKLGLKVPLQVNKQYSSADLFK